MLPWCADEACKYLAEHSHSTQSGPFTRMDVISFPNQPAFTGVPPASPWSNRPVPPRSACPSSYHYVCNSFSGSGEACASPGCGHALACHRPEVR